MLYVSTRNVTDTYTAYHALHEERAPDGGHYVPFHIPVFSDDELSEMKTQSAGDVIARLLNLLFGLHLSGWDVEYAIGRQPFRLETTSQRFAVAELWRNPQGTYQYLTRNLYSLMTGGNSRVPSGWAEIAIKIAVLFCVYAAMDTVPEQGFDVAVTTGDFSDIVAIEYAAAMGLPVNMTLCACNENSAVWDFINRGEFNTNATIVKTDLPQLDISQPVYLECFILKRLGADEVQRYLDACRRKATYYIDETQLEMLNKGLFAAVVSSNRVETIASSMYRMNQYIIDPYTAVAYGGLQDYRARTGVSNMTLIPAKQKPNRVKE